MAEVPEDYDSEPDEVQDLGSERSQLPGLLEIPEDAEPDIKAETGPELLEEMDQEPQPETEEENFQDLAQESTENISPHLKSTRTSEEGIPKESEIDLSNKTDTGTPQEVIMSDTYGGVIRELFTDLEVPVDEKQEQPDLRSPEEATPDVTEDIFIESAEEIDLELLKDTESEAPRATTINETGLELLEVTRPEIPEKLLREQNEESSPEPPEQTETEFLSEEPRKSIGEAVLQPPKVTTPEFPMGAQTKSPEEERIEPSEQTRLEFTEEKPRKSTEETGLESPEETKPAVPEEAQKKSSEEKRTEPSEQTRLEFIEEKLRKSTEEVGLESPQETRPDVLEEIQKKSTEEEETEPSEQTKLEFLKEKPRKGTEEAGLEPPGETKLEVTELIQRMSTEEEETEPSEQTKLGFLKEKPRKATEEAGRESPEDTKPGVSEETGRKPNEKKEMEPSEQTKQEFLDQKPSKCSEETQRKSAERKAPEPLEEIKLELTEGKSRKPIEEIGLESLGKNKSEIQEKTQRKSTLEKVLEPPEDTEPTVKKDKQRKPAKETGLAPPQKSISEDTLRESAGEKGLEPPEQTTPEFTKKETKTQSKSTEDTGQMPPQKTQTVPTKDKDLELPDKAKPLHKRGKHNEFAKEDRSESIKFKHFAEKDEPEDSDSEAKFLVKETKKVMKRSMSGSVTVTEVNSVYSDYKFSEEPPVVYELTDVSHDSYPSPSEAQRDLRDSLKLKKMVYEDEKTQSEKRIELQFECLKWSPENVAEWISKLGFPQYKECFTTNFISGRKLIHVNCSNLPQMGITDFEDMKVISRHTRELLGIEEPLFNRSISLPYRDNIGLFLERKGHSGVKSDSLTFTEFVQTAGLQDYEPPLTVPDLHEALYLH